MSFGPLISPEALQNLQIPYCLLDARADANENYAVEHLEGALDAALDAKLSTANDPDFNAARGGRHPLPNPLRWAMQLGAWGISTKTAVIAYDSSSGANGACRLWWMLRALGHSRVAVLDGGIQAGKAAGLRMSNFPSLSATTLGPYPCVQWKWPTVSLVEVERLVKDPFWRVLDVRSAQRWRGEVEPLDPFKGRIPGSVNLPLSENLNSSGVFKSPLELRELYSEFLGQIPPQNWIIHCGSGVSACHTVFALELAGFYGASLYIGSFSEWCRNREIAIS